MVKVREDLTGQKFGRLIVIKQAEDFVTSKDKHYSQWLCKCDCGGETTTLGSRLKEGQVKSCGCFAKETISKKFKKYNIYDLSGEFGIGYLDNGTEFYFDLEDYDRIKNIKWKMDKDGYIVSNVYNDELKKAIGIKMHRLIMNCPEDMFVDHIEPNERNNNRKLNLRICTLQENNMYRKIAKNNTSGVTGVYWHSSINKWTAFIYYKGKRIELGNYDNFEHAKAKRLKAEKEYYGEFSFNTHKEII